MRLSVITPTADRPQAMEMAERWMSRQTRQPDEWIVADGGEETVRLSSGQVQIRVDPRPPGVESFCQNLLAASAMVTGDLVVIWEDDDYYTPAHLQTLERLLDDQDAVGHELQRYYHLPTSQYLVCVNKGSALCQTGFRRELLPLFEKACRDAQAKDSRGVDAMFWRYARHRSRKLRTLLYRKGLTTVGMKGLPGREGLGIGHRPGKTGHNWKDDSDGQMLTAWLGHEAAGHYLCLIH